MGWVLKRHCNLTFVRRPKNENPMKREGIEQFEIYK